MSRDLRALFNPRSVAILGASNDPAKWGNRLALGALRGEGSRAVYLVNRNGGEILERQAYPTLADLPETPELVVLSVPADGFEDAVDASLAAGAKALVGITTGLGETGDEGRAREAAIVERVRAAGAVLLGPNCLGIFDSATSLDLGWSELQGGSIGLVSQSGNLALELALLAEDYGLGFSRFASLGNQADLEAGELVRSLIDHEPTRVIALYCEDFRDGRAFARAAQEAVEAGKPVVLLTVGGGEVSAQAARSHTGALVSSATAVEAACRAAGMQRVRSPRELVDLAQAELARVKPRGRRVVVVGDGGGHGIVASDVASAEGLELPALSDDLQGRIAPHLPDAAPTRNPVDFAGAGEQFLTIFEEVTRLILESGEVDAALVTGYFGGYSEFSDEFQAEETEVALGMARAAAESGRALVVQSMYPRSPSLVALREAGVPVYREIEAAAWALARLADQAEQPPRGVPELPPAGRRATARTVTGSRGSFWHPRASSFRPPGEWRTSTRHVRLRPSSVIRSSSRRSGSCTSRTPAASRSASRTSRLSKKRWQEWQHCLPKGTPSNGWRRWATASSSSPARSRMRASARSSSSASAVSTRSCWTTPRWRSLPSMPHRPRSSSALSAARRSSPARGDDRPWTWRRRPRRSPRSRASRRPVPTSARSRSTRCS